MRYDLIIPLYDSKVTIAIEEDFDALVEEAGYYQDTKGATAICLHYPDNPSNFVILFKEGNISPGIIAHECFHLTCKIMDAVDIEYQVKNHEAFAYLMGFVAEGIHQIILKHEADTD